LIDFAYDFDGVSNIKNITDGRPTSVVPATDKRRNTQAFTYDDLYRLTQAQYNAPAPASANGGQISYRYDRIGNMLAQTSDITHLENGLSVTDLGQMDSGGTSGRSNRTGRGSNDPPGPHALTRISNSKSQITNREYPYDANGNMTVIDGITNTWDFKDRLIRVESINMVADYAYDYTDRRITKRVVSRSYPLPSDGRWAGGEGITLYIDKYSEVRPGEVATKYIWNGDTRVARLTAQLSPGARVQRLRYSRGWNLLASAVGRARLPSSPDFFFAARWDPANSDWVATTTSDSLAAQTVLWLRSGGDGTLTLSGTPTLIGSRLVNGPGYLSGWGFEPMRLTTNLPAGLDVWAYDGPAQVWHKRFSGPLADASDLPRSLDAGRALFARSDSAVILPGPDPTLTIRFYHQDHLGSSSVLTDAAGNLVEETANYAFGHSRNQLQPRGLVEPYSFTQKERDKETAYQYSIARYQSSSLGRFLSFDKGAEPHLTEMMRRPQSMNPSSYAGNRPIVMHDPNGQFLQFALLVVGGLLAAEQFGNAPTSAKDKVETKSEKEIIVDTVLGMTLSKFGAADKLVETIVPNLAKGAGAATRLAVQSKAFEAANRYGSITVGTASKVASAAGKAAEKTIEFAAGEVAEKAIDASFKDPAVKALTGEKNAEHAELGVVNSTDHKEPAPQPGPTPEPNGSGSRN
jgi:RHS repeat-associated protein